MKGEQEMAFLDNIRFAWRTLALGRMAKASPQTVQRVQDGRLRALLKHAVTHSPFYRNHLRNVDWKRCALTDLPLTDKTMLMDRFDEVVTDPNIHLEGLQDFLENPSNRGKYYLDRYVVSHTSGSSGRPMVLVQEPDQVELLFALQASRGNDVHINPIDALRRRLNQARLAVVTLKPGLYPSAAAFEYMPAPVRSFIEVLRLSGVDDDVVGELNRFRPTHLTAYASMLHNLADEIESGRLHIEESLQQVVNNSEMLTPGSRGRFERAFGVRVLDNYATGECPFLSNGCRTDPGMHVNADWSILEVVDDDNRPVPDGKPGKKVLITNLANKIQPIIRYEVGDVLVMADEPCGCGNKLPRIARIDGRASEVFWIYAGDPPVEVTPIIFQHALEYSLSIREWQVVQEERNRFKVCVQPLPGKSIDLDKVRREIDRELADHGLQGKLQFAVQQVDRLDPDEKTRKFRRVVAMEKPAQRRHAS